MLYTGNSPLEAPLICEIMKLSLISKFTNDSIYHKIFVFKVHVVQDLNSPDLSCLLSKIQKAVGLTILMNH